MKTWLHAISFQYLAHCSSSHTRNLRYTPATLYQYRGKSAHAYIKLRWRSTIGVLVRLTRLLPPSAVNTLSLINILPQTLLDIIIHNNIDVRAENSAVHGVLRTCIRVDVKSSPVSAAVLMLGKSPQGSSSARMRSRSHRGIAAFRHAPRCSSPAARRRSQNHVGDGRLAMMLALCYWGR